MLHSQEYAPWLHSRSRCETNWQHLVSNSLILYFAVNDVCPHSLPPKLFYDEVLRRVLFSSLNPVSSKLYPNVETLVLHFEILTNICSEVTGCFGSNSTSWRTSMSSSSFQRPSGVSTDGEGPKSDQFLCTSTAYCKEHRLKHSHWWLSFIW